MRQIKVSIAAILIAACVFICVADFARASVVVETSTSAMTEITTRSCYSTAQTRHDLTTSTTCYMSGYTQDRLVGRWWQGTCDAGYITINEYQTADNQQRVYRDASLGTPAGFVFESTFACLLPATASDDNTIPVFEMYKASISDYAYVADPVERIALIQDGYTEVGVLGRAKELNRQVQLKQCVQVSNNIHNWVYEDEACPSGYVEELVLEGSLLSNCNGETDPDLTILYKYYSATGTHRFLGTTTTPPAGYNITPLGCFWKPTATAANRIPVYSYSFTQGADKDSRYASTSTTPTAPWVNDNTIIGYTFGQKLVQLLSCTEASGRYYFTTEPTCPSGTTFAHITSMICTLPCIGANQIPVKAKVYGNMRRAAVEPGQSFSVPNINLGPEFVREYNIGCMESAANIDASTQINYPNLRFLAEYIFDNGEVILTNTFDSTVHGVLTIPPNTHATGNALGLIPPRYDAAINVCYENGNTRHYFTTAVSCPEGTTYEYTYGRGYHPPCLSGEIVLNSYTLGSGSRRLGTSAPAGYTFESVVACLKASSNSPVQYELYKSSTTDYKYAAYEHYRRMVGLDGFVFNSQPTFYPAERLYITHRSCWHPTYSQRQYLTTNCASGYISEDWRFVSWGNYMSEPNLVRLFNFGSSALSDTHYSTTLPPPSGYSGNLAFTFIKSVQEPGTYPLYQFRKTGLASGADTFLRINNTFVPPGYSQVGGVLGYVFNAFPSTTNPIYDKEVYITVNRCYDTSKTSTDVYVLSPATCPANYYPHPGFISLPCAYGSVLGNAVQEYCQWTKSQDDVIIDECSNPPAVQLGYTYVGSVGCLATQSSPGLTTVWRRSKTDVGGTYIYYDAFPDPRPSESRTAIGYGLYQL